jgi:serine/threonine kinase 32
MLLLTAIPIPVEWPDDLVAFLSCLIDINPDRRISTIDQFTRHQYMARIDLRAVLRRETAPMFVPKTDSLNCDPTFELEELIVESRPLHKKRSRLKKEQHRHRHKGHESVVPSAIDNVRIEALAAIDRDFRVYNREQVLMNEAERISRLERELGEHRPS